jgi:hypothetical protein
MTSIVEVALRVRLEEAERERDEIHHKLAGEAAHIKSLEGLLVDATRERDEARAALEKKVRGSDRLRAACMRLLTVSKRVIRERNEAYDVIDEINKELNGALGEASSEGESLVDGIRRLRRKTIAVVRQR